MRTLGFLLRLACAYKARVLCNGVFVSGLEARLLSREDAGYKVFFHLAFARIDRERRSVECSILGTGLFREKAVHVDGIGAVLLSGTPETAVRALGPVRTPSDGPPRPAGRRPWPVASRLFLRPAAPASISGRSKSRSTGCSTIAGAATRCGPVQCWSCTTGRSSASATRRDSVPLRAC